MSLDVVVHAVHPTPPWGYPVVTVLPGEGSDFNLVQLYCQQGRRVGLTMSAQVQAGDAPPWLQLAGEAPAAGSEGDDQDWDEEEGIALVHVTVPGSRLNEGLTVEADEGSGKGAAARQRAPAGPWPQKGCGTLQRVHRDRGDRLDAYLRPEVSGSTGKQGTASRPAAGHKSCRHSGARQVTAWPLLQRQARPTRHCGAA